MFASADSLAGATPALADRALAAGDWMTRSTGSLRSRGNAVNF
ncbi:hypothetical protein [Blastococcus mobilis]|nr:hypothetical protein [Blastococcus mobilis]